MPFSSALASLVQINSICRSLTRKARQTNQPPLSLGRPEMGARRGKAKVNRTGTDWNNSSSSGRPFTRKSKFSSLIHFRQRKAGEKCNEKMSIGHGMKHSCAGVCRVWALANVTHGCQYCAVRSSVENSIGSILPGLSLTRTWTLQFHGHWAHYGAMDGWLCKVQQ
jgi:hypothetical protein